MKSALERSNWGSDAAPNSALLALRSASGAKGSYTTRPPNPSDSTMRSSH